MYEDREVRKQESFAKKAGRLAAGALLFGVVAGSVMAGVNLAAVHFLGDP